jgi:hypothetical protein
VLLECENGRAVVYPGGWRITGQPSEADWKRLMDQIRQAGFVAFAVRPSGWYANAFDKLRVRMFRELGTSNSVGRSVFPIKENEPIKPYLPG